MAVQFVVAGIVIEPFDDDAGIITRLARDIGGDDEWTLCCGRTRLSTKREQQPRLTASSESLPYWQPENFADTIWVLQSSLAVTM